MELDDCAFPLLAGVEIGADANKIFDGVNLALLGRRASGPRPGAWSKAGICWEANGAIFLPHAGQGVPQLGGRRRRADRRDRQLRPNTNALIAMSNAPDIPRERFTALTRLDHNRAISQLAAKTGAKVTDVKKMTIWGNHSATQYPDVFHAEIGGKNAAEVVNDQAWIENDFIPTVAKRGAAIIDVSPRRLVGGVGRVGDRRRRPELAARDPRRRLGLDGGRLRWFVRRAGGRDLLVPGDHQGRQLDNRHRS